MPRSLKDLKDIEKSVDKLVNEEFNNYLIARGWVDKDGKPVKNVMGGCHIRWGIKKRIMKERYDIDWKSPADLHPEICFD